MTKFNIFFDVPFVLTSLTLLTGIIALLDILIFSKRKAHKIFYIIGEYARAFFPVFLLVLLIRSFLIQPYKVPTGSLEPTIVPVEFLVVNQYAYGLKLPVLNTKIVDIGKPKRGDIALFRFPKDPGTLFVKRVIGLPGDHIVYRDKTLTINGKLIQQTPFGMDLDIEGGFPTPVRVKVEHLDGIDHKIFIKPGRREWESVDVYVPSNSYFMMGDNRDSSNDSREWGFVPEENLVGKAFGVWISWDTEKHWFRWDKMFRKIQ